MNRLLRWLPQFRDLQRQVEEAGAARILAEDRVMRVEQDLRRAFEMLEAERNRAEQYMQALVNIPYQQTYGTKVFPSGPGLGIAQIAEPYRTEPVATASDAREHAEAEFLRIGREAWKQRNPSREPNAT